ncbi:hypothetical protein B1H18_34615 [Streptomyces tsukubensis]|uniref:Carrier domain-containing protein n=1 Tax=Streptomyces tsukubensis TaxID=83656 RepID=A0A1V3ZZD7_9ACTN|nr:hypothetical protein B1H18_34615 [Streptomyces tsukubensis]
MAGVIKMVMAMRHGVLPRTLHVDVPSRHVDWSSGSVELLTRERAWPRGDRPRRAGVSAFGISGTNAHVILEEAPLPDTAPASGRPLPTSPLPVVLSAMTEEGLRAQARRLHRALEHTQEPNLADLAFSQATCRSPLGHRAAVLAHHIDDLRQGVAALESGDPRANVVTGTIESRGRTAVLFTGQGAQHVGMGQELYDAFPVFAQALDGVCSAFDPHLDRPLREVMWTDAGLLDRTAYTQAGLFALEVALFRLAESWGVKADHLIGHSIGEVVAAHVSAVLTLEDAVALVAARGRLMQALPSGGAMVAVQATEEEVLPLLTDRVSVAAVNGPTSVVISGDEDATRRIAGLFQDQGRRIKRLRVSHAFHSPRMEPMLDEFRRAVENLEFAAPKVAVISNITGEPATAEQLCSPEYWVRHVREAVRFHDGMRTLEAEGVGTFLELGPDAVLSAMGEDCLSATGTGGAVIPVLRAGLPEVTCLAAAVAHLHTRGVRVDWHAYLQRYRPRWVDLPTYAFQRQRYWIDDKGSSDAPGGPVAAYQTRFWEAVENEDLQALASELGVGAEHQRTALSTALPQLSAWYRRRRELVSVEGLRYRDSWQPARVQHAEAAPGRWLLITSVTAPVAETVRALTGAMHSRGIQAATLAVDVAAADRARLCEDVRAAFAEGPPVTGVVSLLPLDESPHPEHPSIPAALAATMVLTQALNDADVESALWSLTRGAVTTGRGDPLDHPVQAHVWGFGRAVRAEQPDRWSGTIDLPGEMDAQNWDRLVDALSGAHTEDQLALRPTGLFVRRLVRAHSGSSPGTGWKPEGTVLVTGGTGAVGAHVARWLAKAGAPHLLLAGRRGPDAPGAAALEAELRAWGSRVSVVACDVADRDALAAMLGDIPEDLPLTAVLHAAGAIDDGITDFLTTESLARTLRPKARAARNLHELTRNMDLSAFVLFSSISGSLGSAGQANYAAANAYLDALAEHRKALDLPATSIAWGAWDGGGLATGTEAAADQLRHTGVLAMAPDLAVRALQQALDLRETCLVVANVDWDRFAQSAAAAGRPSSSIAELTEVRQDDWSDPARANAGPAGSTGVRARLAELPESEQHEMLLDLVRGHAAAVLGHDTQQAVHADRVFRDLGFDSLGAVQLRNRLRAAVGTSLPTAVLFDHPTPRALADHLHRELGLAGADRSLAHLERLEADLVGQELSDEASASMVARLETLLARLTGAPERGDAATELTTATPEELFDYIDKKIRRS